MVMSLETKNDVQVTMQTSLTAEAVDLIGRTVWGTEGALYVVKDFPETLKLIPGAQYLYLTKNDRLVGLRILVSKTVHSGVRSYQAWYHSLFIIDAGERGKGYGKKLAEATLEYCGTRLKGRGFLYAFTEAGNLSSSSIKEAQGYQPVGQFHTTAFSRFFPKRHPRAGQMRPSQKNLMVRRLTEQYSEHSLTDFETSVLPAHYYVLMEGDDIIAGVQAEPQHWQIKSLGGFGGIIALRALPYMPLIRGLFNPESFRFLKLGHIYFKSGHAAAAHQLIESVLAEHQLKTGMAYLDKKSPAYKALADAAFFGILNPLTETAVDVTGYFINLSPEEIVGLQTRPLSICPLDI